MASIGEQIISARKAKGMTQEDIANALNVSRAAVSQWERDRRMPDAGMLLRLSAVLDYSFEQAAPKSAPQEIEQEVEAPVSADEVDTETLDTGTPQADSAISSQEMAHTTHRRRVIIFCAAAVAVVLCVALLIVPVLRHKVVEVPPTSEMVDTAKITKEFFKQDNRNEAGHALPSLTTKLETKTADGIDLWSYEFIIHEKNGMAFDIDRVETYTFVRDKVDEYILTADMLDGYGIAPRVEAYGDWSILGGLPVQEGVSGIGFVVRGTDETGEALSFVHWLPLTAD